MKLLLFELKMYWPETDDTVRSELFLDIHGCMSLKLKDMKGVGKAMQSESINYE